MDYFKYIYGALAPFLKLENDWLIVITWYLITTSGVEISFLVELMNFYHPEKLQSINPFMFLSTLSSW